MDEPSYTSRRSLLNLIICGLSGLALRPAGAETVNLPMGVAARESAAVDAVIDGDTLKLTDGSLLRLAGIEAPKRGLAPGDTAMTRLATAAEAALRALVGDGPLTLQLDAGRRDRYGRRLAQAVNDKGDWLQAVLIGGGNARVRGDGRNRRDLRTLLHVEAQARAAAQGIWRHPAFAVRRADDPKLARFADSFQIIEGRVVAAALAGGMGYINFGLDRETDLTLVVKKPALDPLDPAMLDLTWLTSKAIRCRGWLDLYKGPRIDISHPEQIEVLET